MKILIACEESQRVCTAFREKGHTAFSCDLLECSGDYPEWHIKGDVTNLLNGDCTFTVMTGDEYTIKGKWDMIIAHPPCTRLCSSGQRWIHWGSDEYRKSKISEQNEAINFFMLFTKADCDRIAIENPVGIMSTKYRKPDCIYNPYDFKGETDCKKTCLWLKGLEPLRPNQKLPIEKRTNSVLRSRFGTVKLSWSDPRTARYRSITPVGVARAMAEQWG